MRIKSYLSQYFSRKLFLLTMVLIAILFIISWGILSLENNDIFARFSLTRDLTAMDKQIRSDLQILKSYNISAEIYQGLSQKYEELKKNNSWFFYDPEHFEEVKNLYDSINSLKEEEQMKWHKQLEDKFQSVETKFTELKRYGVDMTIKKEEMQQIKERLQVAKDVEDFQIIDKLVSQVDFFLQDQINVKETIYLQDNLQAELGEIKELLKTGRGLGLENKELESAVKQLDINHTTSSPEYLTYLHKYQKILVDGKLSFKDAIEKKKRELEQAKGGYIAIIPPYYPVSGKSIEISIAEQVLRSYENGEQVFSSFVVTGKNGWWTSKGVHKILYKQMNVVLAMDTPDYYRIPVKYWMPFTYKGEGIHDATYRRVFGPNAQRSWNGSHGCVNSPIETARFIYNWADVGTSVVVY